MHRFYTRSPDSVAEYGDAFRRALCDRDPSVMSASLCIFHDMCKEDPSECKDLVPSFVSILKQVAEHRLSKDYEYHRVPAPWIQIKLLKLLGILGADDQKASEGMYQVLHDVIKAADTGINAGYAIIYECVRTICAIYPNKDLIQTAATSISRLITSDNHNHKYLGITGLASIVHVNPKFANKHQMVVIDALEDPDDTLKRKTLDLLYKMVTKANVTVIVEKKIEYLRSTVDVYLRTELVSRITTLAERFAPNASWYIETMNTIFELGGDLVRPEVAHNLLRLLAEGAGGDEDADNELRTFAVDSYLQLCEKTVLPDILVEVICWVVGEYSYLSETHDAQQVVDTMVELVYRPYEQQEPRCWAITALMKICSQNSYYFPAVKEVVNRYKNSNSVDLQQRCYELEATMANVASTEVMDAIMPIDGSCEDLEVDVNLSFLDWFVEQALEEGAEPYLTIAERRDLDLEEELGGGGGDLFTHESTQETFKFDAYAAPERPKHTPKYEPQVTESPRAVIHNGVTGQSVDEVLNSSGLNVKGVKKVWGKKNTPEPEQQTTVVEQTMQQVSQFANEDSQQESDDDTDILDNGRTNSFAKNEEPAKPKKPARLSEKEKFAASLFGGLGDDDEDEEDDTDSGMFGGSSASGSGPRFAGSGRGNQRFGRKTGPGSAKKQPQQQQEDLIGGMGSPSSSSNNTSNNNAKSGGGLEDLLGGLDLGGSSPASTANNVNTSSGGMEDLLSFGNSSNSSNNNAGLGGLLGGGDLLSGLSSSNSNNKKANNSPADPYAVFGGGDLLGSSSNSPSMGGSSFSVGGKGSGNSADVMPQNLLSYVSGAPRATSAPQYGESDSNLTVMFQKVYKSDELVVAMSISNNTGGAMNQLTVTASASTSLSVAMKCNPEPSKAESNTQASWNALQGDDTLWVLICMTANAHAVNLLLDTAITYSDSNGNQRSLSCSVPLSLVDLLRPFAMTTEQFGASWNPHNAEQVFTVSPANVQSVQDMQSSLQQNLNVQAISIIQSEGISCGQLLNTQQLVLVHGTYIDGSSPSVKVTLRSKDQIFTSGTANEIQRVLGN
eukprot:TRINITY_DN2043_c0_g1_i4.p1 TRINITY_DN2043_c0_g1~~TRINITY_DN2043_c0_g1_i4.p1  ORF type:complete len:1067 (-),score=443.58 TRINITY_DN2043_c0_g1_i4:615-3815(-)